MRYTGKNGTRLEFEIEDMMRQALCIIFERFPMKETPILPLSRTMDLEETIEEEEILKECLEEDRTERSVFLKKFLDRKPFTEREGRVFLTIDEEEVMSLLAVINNVGVGCWAKLGCPEELHALPKNPELFTDYVLMRMSQEFQWAVIKALPE